MKLNIPHPLPPPLHLSHEIDHIYFLLVDSEINISLLSVNKAPLPSSFLTYNTFLTIETSSEPAYPSRYPPQTDSTN